MMSQLLILKHLMITILKENGSIDGCFWNRTKGQVIYLLSWTVYIVISIVNNRNILTDGTNERKYLWGKYDKM